VGQTNKLLNRPESVGREGDLNRDTYKGAVNFYPSFLDNSAATQVEAPMRRGTDVQKGRNQPIILNNGGPSTLSRNSTMK
jgi:hypothetical protein